MFMYLRFSFVINIFHLIDLINMKIVSIGNYSQQRFKLNEPNCGQSFISINNDLNYIKTCFLSPYESEMFGNIKSLEDIKVSERIFKGTDAKFGQSPYTVLVEKYNLQARKAQFCTGVLISYEWLLTAAHCLNEIGYKPSDPNITVRPDKIRVYAGSNLRFAGQKRYGNRWLKHSQNEKPADIYDIGMVRVNPPFDQIFDSSLRIIPICLPEKEWVNTERINATSFGWGIIEGNDRAKQLQTIQVTIEPFHLCSKFCSLNFSINTPRTCPGDSGGPLVIYDERAPVKKAILIGVTAGGKRNTLNNSDCSHENILETYYVSVPHFIDWIFDTIRENTMFFN